jgi:3'(2'), 5'-bisphosphate nucleotidase
MFMAGPQVTPLLVRAIDAVRVAGFACARIQHAMTEQMKVQKTDKSPVTIADFCAQAIVCRALHEAQSGLPVVGEEGTGMLRMGEQAELRKEIAAQIGLSLNQEVTEEQALKWIDLGANDARKVNGPVGEKVFWTLDPIDGTKGFIRGEQYAVCLALIAGKEPVLAVMACPNLEMLGVKGVLAFAIKDKGAWMVAMDGSVKVEDAVRLKASGVTDVTEAVLAKSVESGHSDMPRSVKIANALGVKAAPMVLDSQAKYALVAGGVASIYMRLPMQAEYHECIWDHAAGVLLVTEAGGKVTDVGGKQLDFSRGSTLLGNRGVIAAGRGIFSAVLGAVKGIG